MKTRILTKLIAAAAILGVSASLGLAQDTDTNSWNCPLGNQPGYGRSVNAQQQQKIKKNARRAPSARRNFGFCQRQGQGQCQRQGRRNDNRPRNGRGRGNGICPWQNSN